jgi:calcineurin-like phosphoesterase family protein
MIKLKASDNIWFTSDLHISHKNICRGESVWKNLDATRDFETIHEMNKLITKNINDCVQENDHLFILGDLLMGNKFYDAFFDLLICKNIYIIYGNHDKLNLLIECKHLSIKFQDYYLNLMVDKQEIILFHYPILSWENSSRKSWHLYGHCHNSLNDVNYSKRKCFDVGIDWKEFRPYCFEEIKKIMDEKEIIVVDHH